MTTSPTTRYTALDLGAALGRFAELQDPRLISLPAPAGMPAPAGLQVLATGKGIELHSLKPLLDEYLERPERIRTEARLDTLDSLIAYANRFKRPESAIFVTADPKAPKMLALLDYHGEGAEAAPSFCTHKASYAFPLSLQFRAWIDAGADLMRQDDFAAFLEDHIWDVENPPVDWLALPRDQLDLVLDLLNLRSDPGAPDPTGLDPDPDARREAEESEEDDRHVPRSAVYKPRRLRPGRHQEISALARGIEVPTGQKAKQSFNQRTGEREIFFGEEHDQRDADGRRVTVPDLFFLHIPVFDGGTRQLLPVRLFYRLRGGSVMWGVELIQAARLVRRAVEVAAAEAGEKTGLPVYFGLPNKG